ncbi:MAG: enoyl-CoA hydratase/isomerase family protein [Rhodospirillaceae bacterium]
MDDIIRMGRIGTAQSVACVTLNRPERAHAYTVAMLEALQARIAEIAQDPEITGVILTATGDRAFCSGADRDEIDVRRAADGFALLARDVFTAWQQLPMPTVAALNGIACGGGLELALACDLRICTPQARFWLPETGFGLTPAAGGMEGLHRVIGSARAREMILFGRQIDAPTALDWGLVSAVGDTVHDLALAEMERVAERSPLATRAAKRLLNALDQDDRIDAAIRATQAALYEHRFAQDGGAKDG